jgi:GAF domain-containing protein
MPTPEPASAELDDALNSYHNKATPAKEGERPDLVAFYDAADRVLALAAELARVVTHAHQGAATRLYQGDWAQARKYFSLSRKYAEYADYDSPATGFGIHAYIPKVNRPMRLTQQQLEAHPEWKNFGTELGKHPPMRGWIVVPLIGSDGQNYGFIQASDRVEGDFSEQDEANLVRLGELTSTALDSLEAVYLPDYYNKLSGASRIREEAITAYGTEAP